MFHRKDIVPLVFLLLVIVTIMITLSQILVVHNKHHPAQPDPRDLERFKVMLVQLERHISSMLKKDVLPLNEYKKVFAAEVYAERINNLINQEEAKRQVTLSDEGDIARTDGNIRFPERRTSNHVTEKVYSKRILNHDVSLTKAAHSGRIKSWTKRKRTNQNKRGVPYRKGNHRARTEINRNDHISKTNEKTEQFKLFHNNLYSTSSRPEMKSSRSLLLDHMDTNSDVTRESHDISGHTGEGLHLSKGKRIVTEQVTTPRAKIDMFSKISCHGDHQMTSCSEYPAGLVGRISVEPTHNISHDMFKGHMDIRQGGWWSPPCLPRHKVAIIIPYRERKHHLLTLLYYLIPILKRQLLEFRIFVVEQEGNHTFNKGIIMNAGFKEAVRLSDYHCYIFHDVDLIPENDRNLYTCPGLPRHLSVAVDKFGYRLPYTALVGGVFAIRREDFETVNGYSNLYWGWGAEDDDMSIRLSVAGLPIARPSPTVARYKMLKHKGRVHAPGKWTDYLLKTVKKRFYKDGLSTVNYNVTFIHLERLFTHIMVDAGNPPSIVGNISAIIR